MPRTTSPVRHRSLRLVAILAVVVLAGSACMWRGLPPTGSSIAEPLGPFAYASVPVAASVDGFGGGTIWYPVSDDDGEKETFGAGITFGGVAVVPGFLSPEASIAWYGPKLASNGFVVITIASNSPADSPSKRGQQLLAALDYLTTASPAADLVDAQRLAVMGWSMGGGGALSAASERPGLKAAVSLAGWSTSNNFSALQVPTLVVGCELDVVAANAIHSLPIYNSITAAKAYLEVAGDGHRCVTEPTAAVAASVLSWMKYYVDGDRRYLQFLCPAPVAADNPDISKYLDTCAA